MKTCTKCLITKAKTEFYKKGDKLYSACKACHNSVATAWQKANPGRHNMASAKWKAANKERQKAYAAAWAKSNPERMKASQSAWAKANPERKKAAIAAWMAKNPGKAKKYKAAWKAANPDAVRIHRQNYRTRKTENGGTLSKGLSDRLFALQRGKCACCGKPLGKAFHLDHIIPLALGGTNDDDNIQLLRPICNKQKHAKHPVDFMQQRGFLL